MLNRFSYLYHYRYAIIVVLLYLRGMFGIKVDFGHLAVVTKIRAAYLDLYGLDLSKVIEKPHPDFDKHLSEAQLQLLRTRFSVRLVFNSFFCIV